MISKSFYIIVSACLVAFVTFPSPIFAYNPYTGNPFGRYFYVELDKKF